MEYPGKSCSPSSTNRTNDAQHNSVYRNCNLSIKIHDQAIYQESFSGVLQPYPSQDPS
jgi:hypothetical protein